MTVKRRLDLGADTCIIGFGGRDYIRSGVFDASTLTPGGVSEVQLVTLTGSPGGGDFTLSFKGAETTDIAYNAADTVVQTALEALDTINVGDVTVDGSAGGPYTVTFGGSLANRGVDTLVGDGAGLTGGTDPDVAVTTPTPGSAADAGLLFLNGGTVLALGADGTKVVEYTGDGVTNEVQTLTVTGTPAGGTLTLEFDGEVTAAIAYNAAAAAIQTALEGLPNIDPGDVVVTGGALPGTAAVFTFGGQYEGQSVPRIEVNAAALTGGTNPAATVAQTTQGADTETIVGIFDGRWEFIAATREASRPVPIYGMHTVFDKAKVRNYDEHEGALLAWASAHFCEFREVTA